MTKKVFSGDDEIVIKAARQVVAAFDALAPTVKGSIPPLAIHTLRSALRKYDGALLFGRDKDVMDQIAAMQDIETACAV